MSDRTPWWFGLGLVVFLGGGWLLPSWAQSLAVLALGKGLVVLGLLLLMRCGLVSFGQGLFYCLGAYAAVSISKIFNLPASLLTSDAVVMPLFGGVVAGAVARHEVIAPDIALVPPAALDALGTTFQL